MPSFYSKVRGAYPLVVAIRIVGKTPKEEGATLFCQLYRVCHPTIFADVSEPHPNIAACEKKRVGGRREEGGERREEGGGRRGREVTFSSSFQA